MIPKFYQLLPAQLCKPVFLLIVDDMYELEGARLWVAYATSLSGQSLIERTMNYCSTPFELHDDAYVLKAMNLQEQPDSNCPDGLDHADFDDGLGNFGEDSPPLSGVFQRSMYPAHPSSPYYASMSSAGKNSSWPPVPGILKSKVKHENAS